MIRTTLKKLFIGQIDLLFGDFISQFQKEIILVASQFYHITDPLL